MKKLDDDAYISQETGELYLMTPGVRDPFAPPNSPDPPRVLRPTGYTFEDVPTYGWPLGVIYQNNPLQFATEATTARMISAVQAQLPPQASASMSLDIVKVGPYTRLPIRQVRVSDAGGLLCKLNAGELASELARFPQRWRDQVGEQLAKSRFLRDRDDE
jgi:hypothetical protein